MGKVFWNKREIPIPNNAYIDKSDGRVLVNIKDGEGKIHRRSIGYATSSTTMHPNELFKALFPGLWERQYGAAELKEYELNMGMYALTLGIAEKTTLYSILQEVYGPQSANALLDYAMYSILDRTNTTQLYPTRMERQVIFSKQVYSDEWYSNFFRELTEDKHHLFRMKWLQHCKDIGITKAWISIDGSNNDCEVKASELSEFGKPKSHNENKKIVSYMYAVSAENGMPITYFVYEGAIPDCKAFHQMALFLGGAGIEIEGVILDRGFCTDDVIQTLRECRFNYIIMMHGNYLGHINMLACYGGAIHWNPEYAVSDDGVFGTTSVQQLFNAHPTRDFVNLYFDGAAGSRKSIELIGAIRKERRRIDSVIAAGKKPVVSAAMEKYIEVEERDDDTWSSSYKFENWKKDMTQKGYFSIASSQDYGTEETLKLYHLRDASETQYCILKSQEGCHTTRVHSTPGIRSKFAEVFIASILRCSIQIMCKELGYDTNEMIRKMDRIRLLLIGENQYAYTKNHSPAQIDLLNCFGITEDHLSAMADDVNRRMTVSINSQVHSIPDLGTDPHLPKRKRGRQKGSKNRATIQREKEEARMRELGIYEEKPKRGPGRPKGKKDSTPRVRRTKAELANTTA